MTDLIQTLKDYFEIYAYVSACVAILFMATHFSEVMKLKKDIPESKIRLRTKFAESFYIAQRWFFYAALLMAFISIIFKLFN